jgi:glutamate--cysteine ligase
MRMSRVHHEAFLARAPEPQVQAALEAEALDSLARQAALEAEAQPPFETYLEAYFADD